MFYYFKNNMEFIDLSHTIEDGTITYKGLPAPIICDYYSHEDSRKFYEKGTEFHIGHIKMVSNTGTYLDCPFHRYKEGKDLSETSLERLANISGLKVKAPFQETLEIDKSHFENLDVKDKAVLVQTGWSEFWQTEKYFENHPYLTEDAAQYLVDQGVKLVGIDSYNIDDTSKNTRPVHSNLLQKEICIVEHLCNLEQVPENHFTFTAVPPKIVGMGTFPVRAFAQVTR